MKGILVWKIIVFLSLPIFFYLQTKALCKYQLGVAVTQLRIDPTFTSDMDSADRNKNRSYPQFPVLITTDSLAGRQVDALFREWDTNSSPGYAVGVIKDGQLIYSKGFGLANLEDGILFTDKSAFYIGSMAKQFTAAALLLLEEQGKIYLDDPVQKYLADFPSYGQPITLRQLVHHTSGIREYNSLQLFAGINPKFEEHFTARQAYHLQINQKELNFPPNSEYRYSSGGYIVLAKVIEKVSGMPFRSFMDQHIFKPLAMTHTFVFDNHNQVVKNKVSSYWPIDTGYETRSLLFDSYGDGSMMTTIEDWVKWDNNFYNDKIGIANFDQKMRQRGVLSSKDTISYAFGVEVRKYIGITAIQSDGAMLGYRVSTVRFPDQKFTAIVFGNAAFMDPIGKAYQIANIFLNPYFQKPTKTTASSYKHQPISRSKLQSYQGYYWSTDFNYFRQVLVKNDTLFFNFGDNSFTNPLLHIGEGRFIEQMAEQPTYLSFSSDDKGQIIGLKLTNPKQERKFKRFTPKQPSSLADFKPYEGQYYSSELDTYYKFFIRDNTYYLQINKQSEIALFPKAAPRIVWNNLDYLWIGFGEVMFTKDSKGKITGFHIGDGRVKGVKFEKLSKPTE